MAELRRRVVVVGGAGFIGSHLVERLLTRGGAHVVVLDDFSSGRRANLDHLAQRHEGRLQVVGGDVRDGAAVAQVTQGADTVYHLAARRPDPASAGDAERVLTTNVHGTFNVLDAAQRAGVRRLVFASARDVYGEPIALPVDEEHPLIPITTYGASKVAGEVYCRAFRRQYGLPVVVLRLATVYGPRDHGTPIAAWLDRAAAGLDLDVYGGDDILDVVWVEQVVEALVRAGAASAALPPINIGSGTGTRLADLARRIARFPTRKCQIKLLPNGSSAPVEPRRFVASVDRMRDMLRLEPPLDPLAQLPSLFAGHVALNAALKN